MFKTWLDVMDKNDILAFIMLDQSKALNLVHHGAPTDLDKLVDIKYREILVYMATNREVL